jgi:hypothetical protein
MTVSRKRITAIAFVAGAILAAGGGAVAYWTLSGTGSGTGNASTGSAVANAITVTQTSTVTNLRPGGAAQALSGNVVNGDTQNPVFVASVTVGIGSIDKVGCTASDYTISGSPVTVGVEVPASGSVAWSGATIAFNDKPLVNQNACQGAIVTLSYTAN